MSSRPLRDSVAAASATGYDTGMKDSAKKPLVLMILDGWGVADPAEDNAISQAHTPHWQALCGKGVQTTLATSGEAVGLPDGQMGNSEVGHMNLGAGRIVYQDFTRISRAVKNDELGAIAPLQKAFGGGYRAVHILGLVSPGGVHSHEEHLFAAITEAAKQGAKQIVVHAFLDGRDTPPRSALASLQRLQDVVDAIDGASIATVTGRYFAMDRDQRWDRVERAWRAIVRGDAEYQAGSAVAALEAAYARDEGDEFVAPTVIGSDPAAITADDAVVFVNFRADRARQMTAALAVADFDGFERGDYPIPGCVVTFTEYEAGLPVEIAFAPEALEDIFAEIIADAGLRQLRIAETEKYAHVTFFFNGGREAPFPGEKRRLIPSPKVATYDLQPEMSAPALTDALVSAIESADFDVIICNVANPDMVGHTGDLQAAVKAVEAVDLCLGRVSEAIERVGGELLITADHGNVEDMIDEATGQPQTAHTTNPVPLLFIGRDATLHDGGSLRDIAPTMLALLDIPTPAAMTGRNLVETESAAAA